MNLIKFNEIKSKLVGMIDQVMAELLDKDNKEVQSIKAVFTILSEQEAECVKMVMDEILSKYDGSINGRIDTFDFDIEVIDEPVRLINMVLFLAEDKDRFDHADINRVYGEFPELYTKIFEPCNENDFISTLFGDMVAVKEKTVDFSEITTNSTDGDIYEGFIDDVVKVVERYGLNCKAIKRDSSINGHLKEKVTFYIYREESEVLKERMGILETRNAFKLVK